MNDENTIYEYELMTGGWSLNMVASQPLILSALRKYCADNNRYPVRIVSAIYQFMNLNGAPKTLYSIHIEMANGKGKVTAKWIKDNQPKWSFDGNHTEAREC